MMGYQTGETGREIPPMILHCDRDAFYASVEERDRPDLVGHPMIVGGSPESRGVVAAANCVARKYGIHSEMPATIARWLCPQGVFLSPRISYYAEVSCQIRERFGSSALRRAASLPHQKKSRPGNGDHGKGGNGVTS